MLTKQYPFGAGESFIENEINFLARGFQMVYLFPTEVARGEEQTREVPANVKVAPIFSGNDGGSWRRHMRYGLKALPHIADAQLRKEYKNCTGVKQAAAAMYVEGVSRFIYQQIIQYIDKLSLAEYRAITVYSYWLIDIARVGFMVKNHILALAPHATVRAISRGHRYDLYAYRNALGYLPFQGEIIEKLDGVYPCSEDGTQYLKGIYKHQADKVRTAYLGTQDHGLGSWEGERACWRMVTCSSLVAIKQVALVAQALAKLEQKGLSGIVWECFGDGPLREEIERYVKDNVHQNSVIFHGAVPNKKVMAFYKQNVVQVFINTSQSEGLPVSIMEAQSFGIPVLATKVGGVGEIIIDGENGYLMPAKIGADEVAQYIERLYRLNEEAYRAMRTRAREIWLEKFNMEKNYPDFVEEIS
ncbi:glycosyltransferase [Christensenellaceae bacterium NSJ-44]|uniref:Glycosyltransferase n=1 Tax=Luoshenia tenuis TaxID=2763654 RepID=A0A926HMW2_9FIRM|nr:glycosyltransferase [Luoshenia tenuis]MBC8529563.1 glycosyltransferase [Luoshenia tenuis]